MRNFLPVLFAMLFCAACDTPQGRIRQYPQLYEKLDPAVQERVREGKVAIGYTKEAVIIALGKPHRRYHRQTEGGSAEVWSYVDRQESTTRQRIEGEFRVRDSRGRWFTVRDDVWVDVPRITEYERMRLTFRDGVVIAIDREVN